MKSVASEVKHLSKHSVIYGIGNLFSKIAAFLLLPIYTTFLTPHDYGIKELVAITIDVVSMLSTTAISASIFRFYYEYDNIKTRYSVISTSLLSVVFITVSILPAIVYFSEWISGIVLGTRELAHFFVIGFTTTCFQSVNGISYAFLRLEKRSTQFIVLRFLSLILQIGLNIYFICFMKIGVVGVLYSALIASVAIFCFLTIPVVIKVRLKLSITILKEMLKFGMPLIPSQFGAFIVHLSDRFFLRAYIGVKQTGIYSLGYRLGVIPSSFISEPFNMAWQPKRMEIQKENNAKIIYAKVYTYYLALIVFASLAVILLSEDLLKLIAKENYWDAYEIVPIIALGIIFFTSQYHFNIGILITKKTKYFSLIDLSNAVLITFLNFMLIPKYGMWGAAFATLAAFLHKVSLIHYYSQRLYYVPFEKKRILKLASIAMLIFMLFYFIKIDNIFSSILLKMMGVALYPVLLLSMNFFNAEEKLLLAKYLEIVSGWFRELFRTKSTLSQK